MIKKVFLVFSLIFITTIFLTYSFVVKLPNHYNLLLLGLDPRDDSIEKTMTTDTIIFASFNFEKRHLSIISLPRDLWSYSTTTKINQIYPDSLKPTPNWDQVKQEFTYITGQKINDIVVITTENLTNLITVLGGVTVNLKNGFIDKSYPNPEYIKNPSPRIPIYITIEFPPGDNLINSSNIVPFTRSRKSSDNPLLGGTDLGRIERQQLLIEAISKQSLSPSNLKFNRLNQLYRFWKSLLITIEDRTIFALSLKFVFSSPVSTPITLHRYVLNDLIYHPDKFTTPAWVFLPKGEDYQEIHQFIQKQIN
ncbi:MAG: LCP family protein [Candidatus Shapirobacteria bacterium]|jgi:anionic cell wall polymer biosynthesis LytR-Cps2A-Psr (LCP) family protein